MARLVELIGKRASTYLLATLDEAPSAEEIKLDERQEEALSFLARVGAHAIAPDLEPSHVATDWRRLLMTIDDSSGLPYAQVVRVFCGGDLPAPSRAETPVERLVVEHAGMAYAAHLAEIPPGPWSGMGRLVSLWRREAETALARALADDPAFSKLFTENHEEQGVSGYAFRSTGHGGTVQVSMFAATITSQAWETFVGAAGRPPTFDELETCVIDALRLFSRAILGDPSVTVPTSTGLAGVKLPAGVELELDWGRVRRADERDDEVAERTGLPRAMAVTSGDGSESTFSLAGDLVLESARPYRVMVVKPKDDSWMNWPAGLLDEGATTGEPVESLTLGLLLALAEKSPRPTLRRTWQIERDPLSQGGLSWFDPSRGQMNYVQLTVEEAASWREWADRVHANRTPSTNVAVRRMLAAAAERLSPDDVLVDAVIVWENLFGGSVESTLRVTSSLAWLLEPTVEGRLAFQASLKKIYAARSRIVHGGNPLKPDELVKLAEAAVDVSVRALRAIYTTHVHLLQVRDSAERSLRILHEG